MLGLTSVFGGRGHFGVDQFSHGGHGMVDFLGEEGFLFVNIFGGVFLLVRVGRGGRASLGVVEEGATLSEGVIRRSSCCLTWLSVGKAI